MSKLEQYIPFGYTDVRDRGVEDCRIFLGIGQFHRSQRNMSLHSENASPYPLLTDANSDGRREAKRFVSEGRIENMRDVSIMLLLNDKIENDDDDIFAQL